MKIVRPFTGTGAIFFPTGMPPQGTCEYATDKCIKHCYQINPRFPNYDEEIRISDGDKILIYNFVTEQPAWLISDTIVKELDGLQTPILHWFGSGDCLNRDVDKISQIITERGGVVSSVEQWGKRKLAYPIEHFTEGSYVLIKFRFRPALCQQLEAGLRISAEILRHLLVKLGG